ncbi:MAG: NifU family protein [Bulleidia sp.]|nr:NifU family protein [Bulleidia sp.]
MSEEEKNTQTAADTGDVVERIQQTINRIRPYIQQDGGDVQLVDFVDGVVTVRMIGACAGCIAISSTLEDGVKAILMDEVPEVTEVRLDETTAEAGSRNYGGNSGWSWY